MRLTRGTSCRPIRRLAGLLRGPTQRHKGKIEAGIKYVQNNALKGGVIEGFAEQTQFPLELESRVRQSTA
jgi:hypothetical protein